MGSDFPPNIVIDEPEVDLPVLPADRPFEGTEVDAEGLLQILEEGRVDRDLVVIVLEGEMGAGLPKGTPDGEKENRRGRKLRPGDLVAIEGDAYLIEA